MVKVRSAVAETVKEGAIFVARPKPLQPRRRGAKEARRQKPHPIESIAKSTRKKMARIERVYEEMLEARPDRGDMLSLSK